MKRLPWVAIRVFGADAEIVLQEYALGPEVTVMAWLRNHPFVRLFWYSGIIILRPDLDVLSPREVN